MVVVPVRNIHKQATYHPCPRIITIISSLSSLVFHLLAKTSSTRTCCAAFVSAFSTTATPRGFSRSTFTTTSALSLYSSALVYPRGLLSSSAVLSRRTSQTHLQRNKGRAFSIFHLPTATTTAWLLSSSTASSSSSSSSTGTTMSSGVLTSIMKQTTPPPPPPPVARREDDRVVYAGIAPQGWDPALPRQSQSSTQPLLDPPIPISDPYGWMRDDKRTNEEVLNYLKAENEYTEAMTSHLQPLRENLYQEMLSTIQETDYVTPRPSDDWYYYTRTFQGKSYTVHCRAPKRHTSNSLKEGEVDKDQELLVEWDGMAESTILPQEQVLLDVNELAIGKKYCSTGVVTKSPSHKLLAYTADFTGGETCQLFIKDIVTGTMIDHDESLEVDGTAKWGVDDSTLFYLKLDQAHRPYQVYRRRLGDHNGPDELLFEEPDELFWVGMGKSLDGQYLFIESSSKETSEYHFLKLHDPDAQLECVAKRRLKVLYDVEHRYGKWWIQSNVGGLPNMALWISRAVANSQDNWELVRDGTNGEPLFPGGYQRSLDHVTCFARHVVASGREGGLPRVWLCSLDDGTNNTDTVQKFEMLSFKEESYDVGLGRHYEFNVNKFVVEYDSLVTPTQSIEISMDDPSKRTILKEKAVPGYDKTLYGCQRTVVTARDGKAQIPVSIVYQKSVLENHESSGKPVHVHLYGYGSYGSCMEASFSTTRLTLLKRGIVFVIAHVRGGGEMGRQWYEEPDGAKYLCKKNTFNDFIDVAQWLVEHRKLTTPSQLSCEGRSAGGLLIGASINQAPELFRVAILGVPFVDVCCTMVDASIPLTAVEWEEWGNPNEEKFFQYMMEYSPTQNVKNAKYPACLLTGGLHDPRVQFWEPSKYTAQLRHTHAQGSGPVCLKMDLSAGHFSASDRYKYLKELAFDYAFLLDQLGLAADSLNLPSSAE